VPRNEENRGAEVDEEKNKRKRRYLTTNLPHRAREHFFALQEAKPDLGGFALSDRIDKPLANGTPLTETMWQRREIQNNLCWNSLCGTESQV
jgi:hypothetical protein